ncbi:uncharacterized protein [Fopius arisanus]|uniref:Platelet-derived growth factor (PDGF) family profile domain-containing protein n=1 Tax=Fopius arisanus TaxID=64838 RepID=A0A9R1T1S3_9HYME|nr:PREDICTED: uncharacterized protein LOC105265413 [Fopius arisanus]
MAMKRYPHVPSVGVVLIVVMIVINTVGVFSGTVAVTKKHKISIYDKVRRLEAVKTCQEFYCNGPQPRTYHIIDLLKDHKYITNSSVPIITPSYLVVKRCDGHAGCCDSPSLTCLAKTKSEKEIEIYRLEANGTSQLVKLTIENHTSCECGTANNKTYREQLNVRKPNISSYDDSSTE